MHLVVWYKNKSLNFRTSDNRTGSNPATLKTYKQVIEHLKSSLGNIDTVEDITP